MVGVFIGVGCVVGVLFQCCRLFCPFCLLGVVTLVFSAAGLGLRHLFSGLLDGALLVYQVLLDFGEGRVDIGYGFFTAYEVAECADPVFQRPFLVLKCLQH